MMRKLERTFTECKICILCYWAVVKNAFVKSYIKTELSRLVSDPLAEICQQEASWVAG